MTVPSHPKEIVKGLLQGTPPSRPLLLPIVFALGAKVENLSFASFLSNPTKICNAMRQIQGYLRTDGASCYFDPDLEMEILGAKWKQGGLIGGLASAEDALRDPRVALAVDVIRRLKTMLRDEPLLMAGVTGPLAMAMRLIQRSGSEMPRFEDLPVETIELSGAVFAGLARTFAEAGANVVFIQEDCAAPSSGKERDAWLSLLEPVCNVIRFYQALPILLLNNVSWLKEDPDWLFAQPRSFVICPLLSDTTLVALDARMAPVVGVALPHSFFSPGSAIASDSNTSLRRAVKALRPAVLTTAGDTPLTLDVKAMARTFEELGRA